MTDLEWIQQLPYKPCKEVIIPYDIYLRIIGLAKRGAVEISHEDVIKNSELVFDALISDSPLEEYWRQRKASYISGAIFYQDELKRRSE